MFAQSLMLQQGVFSDGLLLYTGCESIVHDAFKMAYGRNPHLVQQSYYHSDGETQFTSKETTPLVEAAGFMKSVSRTGVLQDNQPIKSF